MNSSYHVNAKEASPSKFIKITGFSNLKIVHTLETVPESPLESISVIQPYITGYGLWPTNRSEVPLAFCLWFFQAPLSDLDSGEMCIQSSQS